MNLFRSEEHVPGWAEFNPASAQEIVSLTDLVLLMGTESRRHWLDEDYVSRWFPQRRRERQEVLERIGKTSAFWRG